MAVEKSILFGSKEIAEAIFDIIDEAQEALIVVSPYLDICDWEGANKLIESLRTKRKKKFTAIRFFVRRNLGDPTKKSVAWLRKKRLEVVELKGLHAKIYLNERTVLLSSMNMLHSSFRDDNHEVAQRITDLQEQSAIRDYTGALAKIAASERGKALCAACQWEFISPKPGEPLCRRCYHKWKKDLP